MLIFCLIVFAVVLLISFYFWPKDQRSLVTVLFTGLVLGSLIGAVIIIAKSIPVTRKEKVEKVVVLKYKKPPSVVYRDKIVYRIPGRDLEPIDTKSACQGGVALIMDQVTTNGKDKEVTTWILGHVPGSKVQITCRIPGHFADFYKRGSIVQLPANGENS
jgi:hypothetical protein